MKPILLILGMLVLVGCGGTPFGAASEQIGIGAEAGESSGGVAGTSANTSGGSGGTADVALGGEAGEQAVAGSSGTVTEGGSGGTSSGGVAGHVSGAGTSAGGSSAGSGGTNANGGAGGDPNLWLGQNCAAPPWKTGVPYINPDIVTAHCAVDIGTCIPGELEAFICVDAECAQHQPDGSKGTHWTLRERCG